MPVNRVLLIRHGQTDWNTQHRWQGHAPTSLNAAGHAQARALGEYLRDQSIGGIWSSDLSRAMQTAQAVAAYQNLTPIPEARLRELDVGVFQALFPDELAELYPDELAAWRSADLDYAPPRGESRRSLQDRAYAAFTDIVENSDAQLAAVVTHGGTIRLMLQRICPGDPRFSDRIPIPNTSTTWLERKTGGWQVIELTATPHLSERDARENTSQSSL